MFPPRGDRSFPLSSIKAKVASTASYHLQFTTSVKLSNLCAGYFPVLNTFKAAITVCIRSELDTTGCHARQVFPEQTLMMSK